MCKVCIPKHLNETQSNTDKSQAMEDSVPGVGYSGGVDAAAVTFKFLHIFEEGGPLKLCAKLCFPNFEEGGPPSLILCKKYVCTISHKKTFVILGHLKGI